MGFYCGRRYSNPLTSEFEDEMPSIPKSVSKISATKRLLIQMLWLQHSFEVIIAMKAGHPKEDPARHLVEVSGA